MGSPRKLLNGGDWMSCNPTTEIALLGRARNELVGTQNMGHLNRPKKIKVRAVQNYRPAIGPTATSYTSLSLSSKTSEKMWATDFIIFFSSFFYVSTQEERDSN